MVGAMARWWEELRRRCLTAVTALRCTLVTDVGSYGTGALGGGEGKGPLAGEGLEEVLTIEAAMLVA
jgi:hypothetical protein